MASPLSAASAYANIAKLATGIAKPPIDDKGVGLGAGGGVGSFGDVLKQALTAVNDAGKKSDALSVASVQGKGNMVDVVTSVAETEVAINAVVAVRDRVIAAYEEIMRMPI
jgi:flagellar hook-basal body complex protein FliE